MISLHNIQQSDLVQKFGLAGKVFFIGIIALLLLIPGMMVKEIVRDREHNSDQAQEAVHEMWSGKQTLIGPLLEIPYTVSHSGYKGEVHPRPSYFYVVPEQLEIKSDLEHSLRKRGLFQTIVYGAKLKLNGSFDLKGTLPKGIDNSMIDWEQVKLVMSVSDVRGVEEADLVVGKQRMPMRKHTNNSQRHGLEHSIAVGFEVENDAKKSFAIEMSLNGSESLGMIPLGESTEVAVNSSWHSPSFTGQFLPKHYEIGDEGFQAFWKISGLSRGLPKSWSDEAVDLKRSELRVGLMMPVNAYSKSLRVVSYSFLFIMFTFGAMFCAERISGVSIHILQYLITGVAIMIFYVLLLSLAEQIAFVLAYLTAAAVIMGMIASYIQLILRHRFLTVALGGLLALMYSYFYVVLQCEDYALLMGSGGLVIMVSVVMYLTKDLHKQKVES